MIFVQNIDPQGVRGKIFQAKDLGPRWWPIMLSKSYDIFNVIIFVCAERCQGPASQAVRRSENLRIRFTAEISPHISREAAQECSLRPKPWVEGGKRQAPKGRKNNRSSDRGGRPLLETRSGAPPFSRVRVKSRPALYFTLM